MRRQQIARLSLNESISGPPVLVHDSEDQKIADMEASQLPFSCAERVQPSRMESIFVVFPRPYGDGYSGMKIGDLSCRPTLVKKMAIGNIEESLIQLGNSGDSARDVKAVYKIAATLLGTSSSSSIVNVSGLMADHFTNLLNHISPRDVLKHPFFRISQDSWYLSHLGLIQSFVTGTHAQAEPNSHEDAAKED